MNINKNTSIYFIPVGDYFNFPTEECYLVYSPLRNSFFLVLPEEARHISDSIQDGSIGSNPKLAALLPPADLVEQLEKPLTMDHFSIDLLLNERCNFHCSYCYSASGRSNAQLSIGQIKAAIQHVHSCAQQKGQKEVKLSFMGGGEPMLSWNLVTETVLFCKQLQEKDQIETSFLLVTNGSLFDDAQIRFCRENNFEIQVSFEILERIQNQQRDSFDIVSENIKKLEKAGISLYLRSTITENNVDLLSEMIETCIREYPTVKLVGCEPVVDPEMIDTPQKARDFYARYLTSYKAACNIADSHGITIHSSDAKAIRSIKQRFCGPILALTPEGNIVSCAVYSSPKTKGFDSFRYGTIHGGEVKLSVEDFQKIYLEKLPDECQECWARWNCGGGCANHRFVYSPEIFRALCEAKCEMLRFELFRALQRQFKKTTGMELVDTISKKLVSHKED